MFSSLYKQQEYFMKGSQSAKSDFRMFRDYLGLANIVVPGGINDSPAEDEFSRQRQGDYMSMDTDIDYELEARVIRPRRRMNSVESDARSETSTSSRSSDSDASYESLASLSGSEVFVPAPAFPSLPAQSAIGEALHPFLHGQQQQVRPIAIPQVRPGATKNANKVSVCVFCRNNGESREFYSSHTLKDGEGNTTCPILRAYTCPLCKANGDQSHTIKYCPKYTPKTSATTQQQPINRTAGLV